MTLLTDVYLGASKSPRETIAQAFKLLKKAIELDENLGWPHAILGHIYAMQRQYEKAIESGKKALELNPNDDEGYYWLATSLNMMGKPEESVKMHKKAMRLCPIPPAFYRLGLANAYRFAGRYEEATSEYKKVLHLQPHNFFAFTGLTICYGMQGSEEESRAAAAEVLKLNPRYNIKAYLKVGSIYRDQESVKKMAVVLHKAGIPEG